jgi:hypothetical protein
MSGAPRRLAAARAALAAWAVLCLAHAWLIRAVMQNGDCAVYNDQIEQRLTSIRTTHVGYILLGIAADKLLPFNVDLNVNVMNLAFASAGGVAMIVLARRLGASRAEAALAPLLAFAVHAYLRGAVLAEVDVVACSLLLVALALWLSRQRAGAGAAFGVAMLVTPISAFSLPMWLASPLRRPREARRWARHALDVTVFALASLAVYLPLVAHHWNDYWYGGRGLLHAPRERWDVGAQVERSLAFVTGSASPWLALGLAGALAAAGTGTSPGLGLCIALTLAGTVGERFLDVPVQLPQVCVLAVFAVVVASRIRARGLRWAVLLLAWGLTAWPSYRDVAEEVVADARQRATYEAMAAQTPKMLAVGLPSSWEDGLRFERIVYHRTKLDLGMDYGSFRRAGRSIAATRRDYAIWLLSPPPPDIMAPFEAGWRREQRVVLGRSYEVWLPVNG